MAAGLLEGKLVRLRHLRRSDSVVLDQILRDRQATRWLPPRVRRMDGVEFVLHALRERRRHGGEAFTIIAIETGEPVGQVRLFNWSASERDAEMGYWLRRKYWGRGMGTEAVRLGCRFGFLSMRLHRLSATVVVGNRRSARVLRTAGFRVEGTRRRAARVGRGWGDERIFGLLRSDWRLQRARLRRNVESVPSS